jgi:GDP-4-dehydro-6-deoxy-D-mannose reductase
MKTLITGSTGFVGQYLSDYLANYSSELFGTYSEGSVKSNPKSKIKLLPLHIENQLECRNLINELKPDIIYHLAAISFVPDAERNFEKALCINVTGTYNLISSCDANTKIIIVGSAECYGKYLPELMPISESYLCKPSNNYGLTKAMAEIIATRFAETKNIVCIRPFNHIGPGQREDFVTSAFAKQLAQIARKLRKPIVSVGNLEAKRDFTDVRDIVRGYYLAALKGQGTYNLCSGKPIAISHVLNLLIKIAGVKIEVQQDPARMRPADIPIMVGDYTKAKNELGWEPQITLEKSLEDLYSYWYNKTN